MKRLLSYTVLLGITLPLLEDQVNEYLALGYVPVGGVGIDHYNHYMQAMGLPATP
jgi:hypothetical protein